MADARQGSRAHRTWGDATEEAAWTPRVELLQKDDQFVVRAELPGLKKEDVEVTITDDAIVIQGQRKNERDSSFYRAIPLPEGVMADQAGASFEDGVLEITLPAPPAEVRKGRRVEIKSGR
jgi:HSP20 family protein